MATAFTPSWTDEATTILAPYGLIKAESVRAVFDLRTKIVGVVRLGIGFGGSTDLTTGVDWRIYRIYDNDATGGIQYAAPTASGRTTIDPGYCLINNNPGPYAAGSSSIAYDGATGRTFVYGDTLCFWGETAIPVASGAIDTPTTEFIVTGKVGTPFLLDTPTKFAHADNEYVSNGQCWQVWLEGGSSYAIVFDYLDDAAGEAVVCAASMETYDSNQGATV